MTYDYNKRMSNMLKNKLKDYIEEQLANQQGSNSVEPFQIELYKEEKSFLEKHSSIVQEIGKKVTLSEKVQDTVLMMFILKNAIKKRKILFLKNHLRFWISRFDIFNIT